MTMMTAPGGASLWKDSLMQHPMAAGDDDYDDDGDDDDYDDDDGDDDDDDEGLAN